MTFSLVMNENNKERKFILPTKNLVIKPTYLYYNNEKKALEHSVLLNEENIVNFKQPNFLKPKNP
jgi:hypothetical protein